MLTEANRDGVTLASDAFRDDIFRRGTAIYERLRESLEREAQSQFVAIHVDSGDYEVARTSSLATRGLLKRHNRDGRFFGRRIGDEPEYGLAARLFGPDSGSSK